MFLLATRDSWWMMQCEAALLAEGVTSRWMREPGGASLLEVEEAEAERACAVLSELLGEELRRRPAAAAKSAAPLPLQPAFAVAVSLAALTLFFYWVTATAPSVWMAHGALSTGKVLTGEWWRLVTAATLHADWAHALSNAGFFLVLGWAAGERFGAGVTTLLWLLTAVGGFAASLLLSDVGVTLGASGGLFGLLGAAAGHALRHRGAREDVRPRRARLKGLAGAVLLMAFTAFSRRANIHAHVAGFCVGALLGLAGSRRPAPALVQITAALATAGMVLWAWSLAGL